MSEKQSQAMAADWTRLLADPDLVGHLGELLRTYRDAPADKREQMLIEAMRNIKRNSGENKGTGKEDVLPQSVPAAPESAPPFQPDIFTPSWGQDRRRYPRLKCHVAVELQFAGGTAPVWGTLANTSLGGCLVETVRPLDPGCQVAIGIWMATGKIWVKGIVLNGTVISSTPSFGVRLKFSELEAAERDTLREFLKFVEGSARSESSAQAYLASLKR